MVNFYIVVKIRDIRFGIAMNLNLSVQAQLIPCTLNMGASDVTATEKVFFRCI